MSQAEPPQIVTYSQMKESVASLLYLWSRVERVLEESIAQFPADALEKPVYGIRRSIDVWLHLVQPKGEGESERAKLCQTVSELLKAALATRNQVCHGLQEVCGQIRSEDPDAHLAVELSGERRNITWTEMQEMFRWLSRTGYLIQDLTKVALADPAQRNGRDPLASWHGFPVQR